MNDFEQAANEIENDIYTGEDEQENCIEFLKGAKTATVTFSQGRYITKIKSLAEKYPEDVQIVNETERHIVAHVPVRWVKINAPKAVSEEFKEAARERLNQYWDKKRGEE